MIPQDSLKNCAAKCAKDLDSAKELVRRHWRNPRFVALLDRIVDEHNNDVRNAANAFDDLKCLIMGYGLHYLGSLACEREYKRRGAEASESTHSM